MTFFPWSKGSKARSPEPQLRATVHANAPVGWCRGTKLASGDALHVDFRGPDGPSVALAIFDCGCWQLVTPPPALASWRVPFHSEEGAFLLALKKYLQKAPPQTTLLPDPAPEASTLFGLFTTKANAKNLLSKRRTRASLTPPAPAALPARRATPGPPPQITSVSDAALMTAGYAIHGSSISGDAAVMSQHMATILRSIGHGLWTDISALRPKLDPLRREFEMLAQWWKNVDGTHYDPDAQRAVCNDFARAIDNLRVYDKLLLPGGGRKAPRGTTRWCIALSASQPSRPFTL